MSADDPAGPPTSAGDRGPLPAREATPTPPTVTAVLEPLPETLETAAALALNRGRRLALLRPGYGVVGMAVLAVGIFTLAWLAVALAPPDTGVAAWWPAAGLSVVAVAWAPRDRRPLVVLTIAVVSGIANGAAGRAWPVALGFGLSNAAEAAVVGLWLVRGRARPSLTSLEDVFRLIVATLAGGLVMGLGAGLTVALGTSGSFPVTARTVMASHAAAILIMVPLGVRALTSRTSAPRFEVVLQWVSVAVVTVFVFRPGQDLPLSFIPMPFLVWGALRMSTRTVGAQLMLVAVVLTWSSRYDLGPFATAAGPGSTVSVSLVQSYIVVCALVALPLAVSVNQRRAALERVRASERLFRQGFSDALLGMMLLRRCEPGHLRTAAGLPVRRRLVDRIPAPGDRSSASTESPDALDHSGGGLDIVELNDVAARILVADPDDLLGTTWTGRLDTGDRAKLAEAVDAMAHGRLAGWHGELSLGPFHGRRWVEVALSALSASAGDGMFVAQMVDVTARRQAEERLTAQALRDGLTGLANRTLLRDRIDLALDTLPADGSGVAVLFCDLDDFKRVNDTAGHTTGDTVLVEVADRLRALLHPEDLGARPGGDEFVVLRPRAVDAAAAEGLAADVLAALEEPLLVNGVPFSLGASIGIAWGTAGATADDLLRDADAAMYAAKAGGKRRAVVYSDEHRARATRAVRVEGELRHAADRGELDVHLQPVVDLVDGRVVAAEALVRWNHPERGVLAPGEWLDVAESTGLMPKVGAWVLRRSCELAMRWPEDGDRGAPAVHVNVSARQLEVPGYVGTVLATLEETGLAPERLVLEFTETHLDQVSDVLLADLAVLRRAGIGLAADDYGTGYSPLTRVIELPISMLKIDRQFVAAMLVDPRSQAIITTIVGLAESLGLTLVAEGVETPEQEQALRDMGCPAAQGYLWSRPLPPAEFRSWLAATLTPGPPTPAR
jgi:diguanylate cyclase (GGDEF)-like protein